MKQRLLRYVLVHGAILGFLLLTLGLRHVSLKIGLSLPECLMHSALSLYCPFCGGTRAVGALLSGRIADALLANTAVVLSFPLVLWTDIRALVFILRNKQLSPLFPFPPLLFLILFAAFFVLRNVLLLLGIDMMGYIIL